MIERPESVFRRGFVVPLVADTEQIIAERWELDGSDLVALLRCDDDEVFYALFETGMISAINTACGSLLDEHEADTVATEQLGRLAEVVSQCRSDKGCSAHVRRFLDRLLVLLELAIHRGKSLVCIL